MVSLKSRVWVNNDEWFLSRVECGVGDKRIVVSDPVLEFGQGPWGQMGSRLCGQVNWTGLWLGVSRILNRAYYGSRAVPLGHGFVREEAGPNGG
mmetsp:Transcript_33073/g.53052  ORF Transcript_33073/g.53052 Transcript_33073/m.53052 type:complete len:94 (+) Transcript_33073:1368-1649(+)